MKEVKSPKKSMIYYYGIVLLIIFHLNLIVTPMVPGNRVKEVDYGTFMDMIDDKNIGLVQIEDTQILLPIRIKKMFIRPAPWRIPH